jgi:glycosyltransferase involved in cell wall biosynthesis
MRILVISTLYPPAALGGYEVECAGVVERLREQHEVLVLTSRAEGTDTDRHVRRELALLSTDWRGALQAPVASLQAARTARRALAWQPDFVYAWNGAAIPQTVLRVLLDSGCPIAFRVCEHWFAGLFVADQYMRELLPAQRGAARTLWAAGCRALNTLPSLRLKPTAPVRTAISWNSQAIRRMAPAPPFVDPQLERVLHSVPRYGDFYAAVVRDPAPEPEIVFLGRVTPYKGVEVAIRALALLRAQHSIPARLIVLGPEDSEHGEEMRRLVAQLGLGEAVDWRGQVPPEQAAAALARAHAMIVPSVWEEPFPLVTLEGALARVPLVASDVGGIGEGVHHEEHALLFGRSDTAGAAAALARTLQEHEQTALRVKRAYEHAQSFRIGPYLDAQEQFVQDAYAALR